MITFFFKHLIILKSKFSVKIYLYFLGFNLGESIIDLRLDHMGVKFIIKVEALTEFLCELLYINVLI